MNFITIFFILGLSQRDIEFEIDQIASFAINHESFCVPTLLLKKMKKKLTTIYITHF